MGASSAQRARALSSLYFVLAAAIAVAGGLFVPVPGSFVATAWFAGVVVAATALACCGARARQLAQRVESRRAGELVG